MSSTRRSKTVKSSNNNTDGETTMAVANVDSVVAVDESSVQSEVDKLRGRWELASVLNFLNVFSPVLGKDLKLTAEELEMGLIKPNSAVAQLHIMLLKAIQPGSKQLNGSDAWVTVLCRQLALWWPWVADGELPLKVSKGAEIPRYKELDPTCRLLMLKALCEIRADQGDVVSYINDALKNGTEISSFRKDKLGVDGNGSSYWYDGNAVYGYRLYREVKKSGTKTKTRGKACLTPSNTCSQWETISSNFEEFQSVVDELQSSKVAMDVAVGNAIANDAVPHVEKYHKNKQRAMKRKQRQEMLLKNAFTNSSASMVTRSCRTRTPISYTFDEYDRAINEAIAITKRGKTIKEQRLEKKHERENITSNEVESDSTDSDRIQKPESNEENQEDDDNNTEDEEDGDNHEDEEDDGDNHEDEEDDDINREDGEDEEEDENNDEEEDDDYTGKKNDDDSGTESGNSDDERDKVGKDKLAAVSVKKHMGFRRSIRLARDSNGEARNLGAKNHLRQRPTRNSALDNMVLDSDNEKSSEETSSRESRDENMVVVSDSEVSDN